MSVRLVLASAFAALGACKSTAPPIADPGDVPIAEIGPLASASATSDAPAPAPSPPPPATASSVPTTEPSALRPHPGLDERPVARGPGVELLGTACDGAAAGCGRGKKLAVVRQSFWSSAPGPTAKLPCAPQTMTKGLPVTTAVAGCVADGLVVLQSRCIVCRIDSRELMVGRVADMLPAQLKEAQAFAQLDREAPLTTESAWSAAIAKAVSAAKQDL